MSHIHEPMNIGVWRDYSVCVCGRTKKQWWSLISHVGVICPRLKEYVCVRACVLVCVCVCVCDMMPCYRGWLVECRDPES